MDEFLKQARKQVEELDLEKVLKDIDLSRIDKEHLKNLDFSGGAKKLRQQLQRAETQQREEDAASEGFLGGVILGLVVGAILALIFAPRTGSQTREMVAGTASDLRHKAEELVGQGKDDDSPDTSDLASTLPDEPAIERDFGTTERPNSSLI
jgi:hypothetical protein